MNFLQTLERKFNKRYYKLLASKQKSDYRKINYQAKNKLILFFVPNDFNFISGGRVEWQGDKHALLKAENEALNNFVFASEFMQEIKENLKGK